VRLLLDTHGLLWWLAGDERLGTLARGALSSDGNDIYVSAVSAIEITTKHRIGKLPGVEWLITDMEAVFEDQGLEPLPVSLKHARVAGIMSGDHRDPFDRLLAAQALLEDLVLISNDKAFDTFGVNRLW